MAGETEMTGKLPVTDLYLQPYVALNFNENETQGVLRHSAHRNVLVFFLLLCRILTL